MVDANVNIKTNLKDLPLRFVDISLESVFKKIHLQKLMTLFFTYVVSIFTLFTGSLFLMCFETRRNITTVPISELIDSLYQNTFLLMTASLLSLVVFVAILIKIAKVQNTSVQVIGGLLSEIETTRFGHYGLFTFDQPGIDQSYCRMPVSRQIVKNPLINERYHLVLFGDNTTEVFPIEEIVPPSERKDRLSRAKMKSNKYY